MLHLLQVYTPIVHSKAGEVVNNHYKQIFAENEIGMYCTVTHREEYHCGTV